jgi:hypothetical protein
VAARDPRRYDILIWRPACLAAIDADVTDGAGPLSAATTGTNPSAPAAAVIDAINQCPAGLISRRPEIGELWSIHVSKSDAHKTR